MRLIAIRKPRAKEHAPHVYVDSNVTSVKPPQGNTEFALQYLHCHRGFLLSNALE
jgi:hypothetical protein